MTRVVRAAPGNSGAMVSRFAQWTLDVRDVGVMAASQVGIAIPNFWFAILLILVFSVKLHGVVPVEAVTG